MTIREYEKWHGAVLQQVVEYPQFTAINKSQGDRRSTYLINHDRGLFVKYCTQRPYQFTFTQDDRTEIDSLAARCGEKVWIALVCVEDSEVCVLSYQEYQGLSQGRAGQVSIGVRLPKRARFRVSCGPHKLNRLIPRSAFPKRLFEE